MLCDPYQYQQFGLSDMHISFCLSGPIASIFWLDEELCSDIFLDGECRTFDALFTNLNTLTLDLYTQPMSSDVFIY